MLRLTAALALGDLDLLRADLDWLKGLLRNYGLPAELLSRYLATYYQAAKMYLDERGAPLITCLAQFVQN